MLPWQGNPIETYTHILKNGTFMVKVSESVVNFLKGVIIKNRLPDEVTEVHECRKGTDHLCRNMDSYCRKVDLEF